MKSNVGLITVSSAYVPQDIVDKYNIGIVSLTVHIGENCYKETIEIANSLAYDAQEKNQVVTTSQPSPNEFLNAFNEFSKIYDHIICICISSGLSGTYNSAKIALEMYEGASEIEIIDTKSAAMGVMPYIDVYIENPNVEYKVMVDKMYELLSKNKTYLCLDNLNALVKNGRISLSQGIIGSLLSIKPLLNLDGMGKVSVYEKIRTNKKVMLKLVDLATDFIPSKIYVSYTYTKDFALDTVEMLKSKLGAVEIVLCEEVGPVVGLHVGKGGIGVCFSVNTKIYE